MPERVLTTDTRAAVAAACDGRLVGDSELALRGVRALEAAGHEDLSFAAEKTDVEAALTSKAGALLARSAAGLGGRRVIEVEGPVCAVPRVLPLSHPPRAARPGVHPSAILGADAAVDASAEIGPYVVVGEAARVGPGCILEAHAVVGNGCVLGERVRLHPHVVLYDGVVLGRGAEVHSGAVLGADGFGYAPSAEGLVKVPQVGDVVIGEDVEIGANTCIDRAALQSTRG